MLARVAGTMRQPLARRSKPQYDNSDCNTEYVRAAGGFAEMIICRYLAAIMLLNYAIMLRSCRYLAKCTVSEASGTGKAQKWILP